MRVGAILEHDGAVLLLDRGDGTLALPAGRGLEPEDHPESLRGVLRGLGLTATLSFLFAVFDEVRGSASVTSIFYRGTLDRAPDRSRTRRLVPFDEIPWERLRDEPVRAMLERYVRERREHEFGIYVGGAERGVVRTLVESHAGRRNDTGTAHA
jgi:ADP-ribose pyrophosphatase YjhB (NUDIX family)